MQQTENAFLRAFDFRGKSVCVTGAASGIGRATALLFDSLGASVHAADRNVQGLSSLEAQAPGIRTWEYDQADIGSIKSLAGNLGAIDILVNNAGVLLYGPIVDVDWEDMNRVLQINLMGAISLTRFLGSGMVERRRGSVIVLGSQSAFTGSDFRCVYAASKAALSQFARTAALEWGAYGVRVNCVAPGRTLTAMNRGLLSTPEELQDGLAHIPLGRFGAPEDIAQTIVFLSSDAACYTTGQTHIVDGGWLLP